MLIFKDYGAMDQFHMTLCFEIIPIFLFVGLILFIADRVEKRKHRADMTATKRIFFDMDGVLAEFKPEAKMDDLLSDGYYRNLKPLQKNIDALNYLVEKGAEVFILSKVLSDKARKEKDDWLDAYQVNIPKSKRLYVEIDEDKSDYIADLTADDILLDDFSSNLIEWTNAGGTAIKILNDWNGSGEKFKGKRIRIDEPSQLYRCIDAL